MNDKYNIKSVPRIFEQVAKRLIEFISINQLKKGTKLPTERELSDMLGVSRSSVREGLRVLELLKYLDSKQGNGTFVSNPPPFLIPSLILNQKIDSASLNHYFAIALMCLERIVFLSINDMRNENILKLNNKGIKNDWSELSQFIVDLGNQLNNPYYLSLWLNTYTLLDENNYFSNKNLSIDVNRFIHAIQTKDKEKVTKFVSVLFEKES
ncbi:FadR family transcriptional regulator [Peribacillus cavernae]|uniref:FadR family transcriptional regulator n=1 Tax=Peribacillus cavernae TaxID=1674310 RepID=A0A433HX09_9BACI|nr:GntR family transcriptional regulator [Peribacillus cavernae]MDQ0221133.1 DNA-binding FadR family transcriptional regulator [Peribacillus cavernae]RUQ32827.1 FadR family transcriptional regulator [Peribacillus cavernae]